MLGGIFENQKVKRLFQLGLIMSISLIDQITDLVYIIQNWANFADIHIRNSALAFFVIPLVLNAVPAFLITEKLKQKKSNNLVLHSSGFSLIKFIFILFLVFTKLIIVFQYFGLMQNWYQVKNQTNKKQVYADNSIDTKKISKKPDTKTKNNGLNTSRDELSNVKIEVDKVDQKANAKNKKLLKELKVSFYIQLIVQAIPQFIIQIINNHKMSQWNQLNIVSLIFTIFALIKQIYSIISGQDILVFIYQIPYQPFINLNWLDKTIRFIKDNHRKIVLALNFITLTLEITYLLINWTDSFQQLNIKYLNVFQSVFLRNFFLTFLSIEFAFAISIGLLLTYLHLGHLMKQTNMFEKLILLLVVIPVSILLFWILIIKISIQRFFFPIMKIQNQVKTYSPYINNQLKVNLLFKNILIAAIIIINESFKQNFSPLGIACIILFAADMFVRITYLLSYEEE